MTEHVAACSCGQLTAKARTDPIRVSVCHCLACQRRTGSVFATQARFHGGDVELAGRSKKYVRIGDSGGRATFSFCPDCGATVYYVIDGMDNMIAIPVGAFADPAFPAPVRSVYEERMHAWVTMPKDIEHEF